MSNRKSYLIEEQTINNRAGWSVLEKDTGDIVAWFPSKKEAIDLVSSLYKNQVTTVDNKTLFLSDIIGINIFSFLSAANEYHYKNVLGECAVTKLHFISAIKLMNEWSEWLEDYSQIIMS